MRLKLLKSKQLFLLRKKRELLAKIQRLEREKIQRLAREKAEAISYIDKTKLWIREARFNHYEVSPRQIAELHLSRMKIGDRSEALFEKYFRDIFPGKKLFRSSNEHAPFCDALVNRDDGEILTVVEIKSSYQPQIVPMNRCAYFAMKYRLCPIGGKIVSFLYDGSNEFANRIFISDMNQTPEIIRTLSDGRVLCKIQIERSVAI